MEESLESPMEPITQLLLEAMPVLPVRDTVLFPHMVTGLLVGRHTSLRAVDEAMLGEEQSILVVAQRDPQIEDPEPSDLYAVGTEAVIARVLRLPDGASQILVQGQRRVRITGYDQTRPFFRAQARLVVEPVEEGLAIEALSRAVLALFEKYIQYYPDVMDDAYVAAMNIDDPGWLADFVAANLAIKLVQRQDILETIDITTRLQKVNILLAQELEVLELQNEIHSQVQEEMDRSQREHILREQIRVMQRELGEMDPQLQEINELRESVEAAQMPEEVAAKAMKELDRLAAMPPLVPEIAIIRTYLDWLIELPWAQTTEDQIDIAQAARVLDENHYGLKKVKERILEHMAVRTLCVAADDHMRTPILCFVGAPGVGKTSLGQSIATALGRQFVRISLGGVRDEAEIRGHRRTYIGALPGRIIQTMRRAGVTNPLFMMDEIDKLGYDFRGDPAAALLEVLDPEQNRAFMDHYLDVPYDLSQVMFITTANYLDPVPPALLDRMEVIELPGYIEEEKLAIAQGFLVPRQVQENGLAKVGLRFTESALRGITRQYTREAGVRNLEREIGNICRKVARRVAEGKKVPRSITVQALPRYLGAPFFFDQDAEEQPQVGIATGVSWTEAGGDLLSIEVSLMDGKGQLSLTGQLGEVMQESAQAALSYARSHAGDWDLPAKVFENTDIHIHVPAGAIPKDGPSAGITISTALISALTSRPVRPDVAMTGEITLRGRVLPVGGLKEKILAAHRAGIKTFILPTKNRKDMEDIPRKALRDLRFVYVDSMDQVLPEALVARDVVPAPARSVVAPRSRSRRSQPPLAGPRS
ncbi:MAG: endopeptidase La [Chloroflexi bacterium]|nr:endopeptidase La [Chloroflexota bacterium]MBU1752073.1 endopeptidase La [Chloroflexota bacterium]